MIEQNQPQNTKDSEDIWQNLDCRRLLSHMGHDLRTPLNTVLGLTELAKAQSDDKEYVDYCLEKIDASAHLLLDMVTDILYITRLEQGSMKLQTENVDVADMFETLADNTKAMAYEKKINFVTDCGNDKSLIVKVDVHRLRSILHNLLSNAVKFTPRFGRVEFSMSQEIIGEDKSLLKFVVKDTGVGISENIQKKLFTPFVKEYTGSTTVYSGTGLGLAMCKQISDLMGAQLDFTSVKGEGSTFSLSLEVETESISAQAIERASQMAYGLAGKHILLAEDNELNSEIAKHLLMRQGMTVETAENGQVALSKYMSNAPGSYDLILMDVRMPYMDGLTATKSIRSSGKSDAKTIPIVAMTTNAYDEDVKRSLDAGMNAHLIKPVDAKVMYCAIEAAISHKEEQ